MTKSHLLPPNATDLEIKLSTSQHDLFGLRHDLQILIDPAHCPEQFLPFLAWAWSVDYWDWTWPIEKKRRVIASSRYIHQHKGTRAAVQRVVNDLGFDLVSLTEWWQTNDPDGTWRLSLAATDQGIGQNTHRELLRLIDGAKTKSRPLLSLKISLASRGHSYSAAAAMIGGRITVYPYQPENITATGRTYIAASVATAKIMRVSEQ